MPPGAKRGFVGMCAARGHDVRYRHVTPRGQVWGFGGILCCQGPKGILGKCKNRPQRGRMFIECCRQGQDGKWGMLPPGAKRDFEGMLPPGA